MFIQTSHGKQMIIIAIITLFYIDVILVRPQWGRRELVPELAATGRYKTRGKFVDNPLIMSNNFLCVTVTIKFLIE